MIHETVIAAFMLVWLHSEANGGGMLSFCGLSSPDAGPSRAAFILLPHALLWLLTWAWLARLGRRMDRGDIAALARADSVILGSRVVGLLWHAATVFGFGWIGLVRSWVGNPVALDELIAAAPPILGLFVGFAAFQPIEKRVRDATFPRVLHEGSVTPTVHPADTRGSYISFVARQSILPFLIPVAIVFAWVEGSGRIASRWQLTGGWETLLQLSGAGLLVAFSPHLLRYLWSATPMPPSPLRDSIVAVCRRSAVRVRELLVWPTHGTSLNAAVLGFLPGTRFILFTDSMLERLGDDSVQAVTAHEVGHVHERHLPWLAAATAASAGVLGAALAWIATLALSVAGARWQLSDDNRQLAMDIAGAAVGVVTLAGAIVAFGWVSRRFEWQADAFAAADQTLAVNPNAENVAPDAAERVAEALALVAAYNGIPPARFGFRHGSIRTRQRKVRAIAGMPLARLPQNIAARRIKLASLLGIALLGAAYAAGLLDPAVGEPAPTETTP